ncbi:MAG: DUF2207 domain-containing protein [Gemmatimonadales bacterium]
MMRRWMWLLCAVVAAPLTAQDAGWTITSFNAAYTVNPDRTISVVEQIDVDFGTLQRHGIYREIPVKYNRVLTTGTAGLPINAGRVKVDIDRIVVNDAAGRAQSMEVTRGDRVRIRIGDAATWSTGVQRYVIRYRLERGLGFFDTHDELYWQVTGTDWPVPILKASATITIPTGTGSGAGWGAWCYAGWNESSSSDRCSAAHDGGTTFRFASERLEPGEGLTAVAAFPKGVVAEPTAADKLRELIALLWPISLPIGMLAFMTTHWRRRGRDPDPGSVVPYWKPPADLRPGPAGTLWDETSDMNDVVATILDLTVRGFIRITEVPPTGLLAATSDSFVGKFLRTLGVGEIDWVLTRINAAGEDALANYESLVIDGIFQVGESRKMSELNNEFYTQIPKIHKAFYESTVAQGLFASNPSTVRTWYGLGGGLLAGVGLAVGGAVGNPLLMICGAMSGLIVLLFSRVMPARTPKGSRHWAQLRGLEEYLRRAEKLELETSQGPERTTELFETLLPYAVALRVSDIWVKQFGPILAATPPTWYVGSHPGRFSSDSFGSAINSFQGAATRTLGSSPGSTSGSGGSGGGGGGSVGGGGGGGGGGSW